MPNMERELIALARKAGARIRAIYESGHYQMTRKEDRSFLTEADRASHGILCEGLAEIVPGLPILSEESGKVSYEVRKNWSEYFLIDPLDGTREFVRRIPEFAVNIAIIRSGHAVLGLIHSPLQESTYFATTGRGAFRWRGGNRERIRSISGDGVRILLSRTDHSDDLDLLIGRFQSPSITRMGSSLKFCAVADGQADFYPRLKPSMEWDTAAGAILVEESGGMMCELDGKPIEYNRQDMLNPPFYVMGKTFAENFPNFIEKGLRK
jgi:3'(2'), 5'-bisphosphate nucleotidase